MKRLHSDEKGVEPTAMKILAGVVLLAIGLGVGVTVYLNVGQQVSGLQTSVLLDSETASIGIPASGENSETIGVTVKLTFGNAEEVTLDVTSEPDDVSISFNPASGTPEFAADFHANMLIRVYSAATADNYVFDVVARNAEGSATGSARFDLEVTP